MTNIANINCLNFNRKSIDVVLGTGLEISGCRRLATNRFSGKCVFLDLKIALNKLIQRILTYFVRGSTSDLLLC